MPFYNKTLSFKIVSLIEEFEIKRKYINKFYIFLYFLKFAIKYFLKIRRKKANLIDISIELFKERLYLNDLIINNKLNIKSYLSYSLINNEINTIINIGDLIFNINYMISEISYSIYIEVDHRSINITERSIKNPYIQSLYKDFLISLYDDILNILLKLMEKRCFNV